MAAFDDALTRLQTKYNGNAYDPSTNAGGLDNNGHTVNFVPALQDVATAGQGLAALVSMVTAYLAGVNGWTQEVGAVTYLSATQFQIAGTDKTAIYTAGRSLSLVQTASAKGYVLTSSYSGGYTTITVSGVVVDSGLSQCWFGQEVANSPRTASPLLAAVFS